MLFALFLPFTYAFFPHLGIELTTNLSSISGWIALNVFGTEIHASPITSDSATQFVQTIILFFASIPLSFLLGKQKRFSDRQISQFLHTAVAYILAFFLLKYGVDKLFQFQFYPPEPNTLFTPLGMLSKDILFWSSMGTSSSYNTFMGLSEVIPAFLLLHHRTRLLGGLIASGVLINVLMINFGFDITVKLLSSYLLIASCYIISPYLTTTLSFFLNDSGHFSKPNMRVQMTSKARFIAKFVVVFLVFIEVLLSYFQLGSFNGREIEKPSHFGSYAVETTTDLFGTPNIQRIHIHSKGYLILEDHHGNFKDYSIRLAPDESIFVQEEAVRIVISKKDEHVEFYLFQDGRSQKIQTKRIDLESLPAKKDSFHWTVDGMISDVQ